jgi:hypothetical protein
LERKFLLTSLWTSPLVLCMNSLSSRFQRVPYPWPGGIAFSEACFYRSNSGSGTPGVLIVEQISDADIFTTVRSPV